MTERDMFAMMALTGLLAGVDTLEEPVLQRLPNRAYWLADLMLHERDVDHSQDQS